MNEMEPFEQRLKRRPLRPPPAAWREEILSAAREAQPLVAQVSKPADLSRLGSGERNLAEPKAVRPSERERASQSPISKSANHPNANDLRAWKPAIQQTWKSAPQFIARRLASWLWPHPVAWGGLAAIWIFICAANFSMRDHAPAIAEKSSPPSPEMLAELRQQQRLFAELIGPNDSNDADRPKVFVPAPRSERVDILSA